MRRRPGALDVLAKKLGIEAYGVPYANRQIYRHRLLSRPAWCEWISVDCTRLNSMPKLLRVALASGLTVHSGTRVSSIERMVRPPGFDLRRHGAGSASSRLH